MSIRSKIEATIAAHTPAGGNAANRTRAIMHKLITHYYPHSKPIVESELVSCAWEDASEWIYLGTAHSVIIDGLVTPIRYGQSVSGVIANALRESGLKVLPINPVMIACEKSDGPKIIKKSRKLVEEAA
jgi:hypothetical protein